MHPQPRRRAHWPMSTFSQFITQHIDVVVDDFEAFARTSGPGAQNLPSEALCDHAKLILRAVAADMETLQSASAQQAKAKGTAENRHFSCVMQTARMHAQHRFEQGFTLPQMLSEYRALRASVIRRWTNQLENADSLQLAELTRFGEAIDEGLTEAIAWYSKRLENSRNLLIGVLAHDLRTPLSAVRMSAEYVLRGDRLQDGDLRAVTRIASSAKRMSGYIGDLLDFAQTLLGDGLPVVRAPVDLAMWCQDVVDELRAAYPNADLHIDALETATGQWDARRLSQLLSNLVANAINHGDPAQRVVVTLSTEEDTACIEVHNQGEPIPTGVMSTLFQPLMQDRAAAQPRPGSSGLGLGLYIAREIAVAHGGAIEVTSDATSGTTFKVRLPRAPASALKS